MVMARWTLTMKHTGLFLGIEPTQNAITAKGMSVMRFVEGKIVEAWDNWDQFAVMTQLGAISLETIASAAKPAEARVA